MVYKCETKVLLTFMITNEDHSKKIQQTKTKNSTLSTIQQATCMLYF